MPSSTRSIADRFKRANAARISFKKAVIFHKDKKYAEAASQFHIAADEYDIPQAQFNLGVCYEIGCGVPKDELKAFEYYEKAAKNGFAPAKKEVADYYHFAAQRYLDEGNRTQAGAMLRKEKEWRDGRTLPLYKKIEPLYKRCAAKILPIVSFIARFCINMLSLGLFDRGIGDNVQSHPPRNSVSVPSAKSSVPPPAPSPKKAIPSSSPQLPQQSTPSSPFSLLRPEQRSFSPPSPTVTSLRSFQP